MSAPTAPRRSRLLPGLTRGNAVREVLAGVTLLAMSVPLNLGYAQIAGLPATAGLYALVVPSLLFALLAGSRQLVVAPDAAAAALVASSLTGLAVSGSEQWAAMAAAQAVIGGALFLLCARFRLGAIADFLSEPILIGFVAGLALEVLVSQVRKLLGVSTGERQRFLGEVWELFRAIPETNLPSLVVGAAGIAVLLVGRRLARSIPWALVVLVVATIVSAALTLSDDGVAVLGAIPSGPPQLAIPVLSVSEWAALVPAALALTAITIAEGLMLARRYAAKHGLAPDPNRDLAALGVANLAAGLSSSFTVGSSTSRTAAMDDAGARSQLPGVVLAVGSLLLLLFGTSLLSQTPVPVIAAVVAVAVLPLLGIGELVMLARASRRELAIALICFAAVLALGPLQAILIAFVLALLNLAQRAASARAVLLQGPTGPETSLLDTVDGPGETAPGVLVMRLDAPLFFGNAAHVVESIRAAVDAAPHPVHRLVLSAEGVSDVDVTAAAAMHRLLTDLEATGMTTDWARVRPQVQELLAHHGLLGGGTVYLTNRAALMGPHADDGV